MKYRDSNNKKIIWVEKLNILHVLFFTIENICCNIEIRYDEQQISCFTQKILRLLKKTGIFPEFLPAELLLGQKDEKGYALEYYKKDDLLSSLDLFCKANIPKESKWMRYMIRCYLTDNLYSHIAFITMVKKQMSQMKNCEHKVFITSNFANYIIINYFKKKGVKITQFTPIISYLRIFMIPPYFIIRTLLFQIFPKKIIGNIQHNDTKPSVWFEYVGKSAIWEQLGKTFGTSNIHKDYQFVFYLDRPDTPINSETTDYLENLNLGWLDLHHFRHAFLTIRDMLHILHPLTIGKNYKHIWLILLKVRFQFYYRLYLNLFKKFNVKILIQHREASWIQEAQAQAIKSAGGIMIGLHWSNFQFYKMPSHLNPQHVFFTWGKAHYEFLQKKGNTCEYILPCGIWIDENYNINNSLLKKLSKNVKFIMSIFDSGFNYNLWQTAETFSQFYITIIELLEENPQFAAIIKSKHSNLIDVLTNIFGRNNIVSKFKYLINRKRIIILDPKLFDPVIAALHTDLSVCYGINSAGIITGLYDCKAIHWDCAGLLEFPIYKDKNQKILFSSTNEIKNAVKKFAKGDKSIGDFSKWKKKINYFDDFQGKERMIQFIDCFMEEIIKTCDREHSLQFAVKKYIDKNGIPDEIFGAQEWWE
ncbi:hypothetical protein ES705_24187 [subsurface metagenome]